MTLARSPRTLRTLAVCSAIALAGLVGAESSVAKTTACSAPSYPNSNPGGYFTSLQVTRVNCKTGRKLVLSYYKCRVKKGQKGRCTSKVLGYSCKERRPADSQSEEQLNAKVTCKRGTKRIVHTYQQNLT
ncbi:MAG: hypothetical protein ACRDMZ_14315 [Solirubrobacteraceae bacterium]